MSLQLTLARAEMRAAEGKWHDHLHHCPLCSAAARARNWDCLCRAGRECREWQAAAKALVAAETEADAQVPPGQEALF